MEPRHQLRAPPPIYVKRAILSAPNVELAHITKDGSRSAPELFWGSEHVKTIMSGIDVCIIIFTLMQKMLI